MSLVKKMSSVEKAIRILKLLSQSPYELGVTELSEKMDCGKSGIHKLLTYLLEEGLVAQKNNKKYVLGLGTYFLGKIYEEKIGIEKFCKPYLTKLRDMTNENASFGMWVNGEVTMIYKEESKELIRVVGTIGGTRPFYASAVGKVLGAYEDQDIIKKKLMEEPIKQFTPKTIVSPQNILKEFEKVRNQGYAISDEEYAMGTIGIGAPIRNASGQVWAAISLGAPKIRTDDIIIERYIYLVTQTAEMITKKLINE